MDKSKLNYENKFITAEVSKEVKMPIKRGRKNRALLLIFSVISCIVGIVILVGTILLINPPVFDNSGIISQVGDVLNPNTPAELNSLKISSSNQQIQIFGDKIKSPFIPDYKEDKAWLVIKTLVDTKVGYVDQVVNFNAKFTISKYADLVSQYEDDSISYVVNPVNGKEASFYIQSSSGLTTNISTLQPGQYFISTFFNPVDKFFYYSYFDNNSTLYISAVNFDGKIFDLYSSNFLKNKTSIVDVDNNAGYVYLQNEDACYYLALKDKSVNNFPCQSIRSNDKGEIYWSNETRSGIYSSVITGEIYKQSTSDNSRKIIYTAATGRVVSNLLYHNNYLYFVINTLVQVDPISWKSVPTSINKLNLDTLEVTEMTSYMPTQSIVTLVPSGDNLFAIVENGTDATKVMRYKMTSQVIQVPTSYSNSYPASYSTVDLYWSSITFNLDYSNAILIKGRNTL